MEETSGLLAWPAVLRDLWVAMAMLQEVADGGLEVLARPAERGGGFQIGLRYRESADAADFLFAEVGHWPGAMAHFTESFERLKAAAPGFSPEDIQRAADDWMDRHPAAVAPAP